MRQTTLCYIDDGSRYLMLHRVKKDHDASHGKWIGVGGKCEADESPDECMLREVKEETGLTVTRWRYRGIVTFISDTWPNEYMHLFTADRWEGELDMDCNEGDLAWISKSALPLTLSPHAASPVPSSRDASSLPSSLDASSLPSPLDASSFPSHLEGGRGVNHFPASISKSEGVSAQRTGACVKCTNQAINLWEGDKIFLRLLMDESQPFFSLKLVYVQDEMVSAKLDGKPID